jgi:hypothetical protein
MLDRVDWYISEVLTVSIIRAVMEAVRTSETSVSTKLYGATSQKAVIFKDVKFSSHSS